MATWALYALLASAAFGLSAIPLRFAISRIGASAQSEVILLSSCLGSLTGAVLYQYGIEMIKLLSGMALIFVGSVVICR